MVDHSAQRQTEWDGEQLLLHDGRHFPVAVDAPLEVEACAGDLDLVAHSCAALPRPHPQVCLQLGADTQVRGALLVIAGVKGAGVGQGGREGEV